ncbi:hypothetical protein MIR68_001726 [Amoeboaphelidium protococcarum]|nr:hypothetical protein MIR68_001726 [Amoeboaphelidium protococcarum]
MAFQILSNFMGQLTANYYPILQQRQYDAFIRLNWQVLPFVVGIAISLGVGSLVARILALHARWKLTRYLHTLLLDDSRNAYLNIQSDSVIDTVDQRVTQDVDRLTYVLCVDILSKLILSPALIVFYSVKVAQSAGNSALTSLAIIYAYFIVSVLVTRLVSRPLVYLTQQKEQAEGDFRLKHVSVQNSLLEICLWFGQSFEIDRLNTLLSNILQAYRKFYFKDSVVTVITQFVSWYGSIICYIIVAISIFRGVYDDRSEVEISKIVALTVFYCIQLISALSNLVVAIDKVYEFLGYLLRVFDLVISCDSMNQSNGEAAMNDDYVDNTVNSNILIECSEVSYSLPSGTTATLPDFKLLPGECIVLQGVNGSGKSTLVKCLSGLQSLSSGQMSIFTKDIVYLPHNSYILPFASLTNQLAYPHDSVSDVNADLYSLLMKELALDQLSTIPDLRQLSAGEMQRVIFARALLKQPRLIITDEATSSMDSHWELRCFQLCKTLNVSCLWISHNTRLVPIDRVISLAWQ